MTQDTIQKPTYKLRNYKSMTTHIPPEIFKENWNLLETSFFTQSVFFYGKESFVNMYEVLAYTNIKLIHLFCIRKLPDMAALFPEWVKHSYMLSDKRQD